MDRKVVLVVEDNRDELMIYTTLLSYKGYAILTAADYHSALSIAIEHQPDLAIVDVNLGDPTVNGTDLVRELRQDERTAKMPIIAHTAYDDVYGRELQEVGCDLVMHKPTDPTALLEAVARFIGAAADEAEADAEGTS